MHFVAEPKNSEKPLGVSREWHRPYIIGVPSTELLVSLVFVQKILFLCSVDDFSFVVHHIFLSHDIDTDDLNAYASMSKPDGAPLICIIKQYASSIDVLYIAISYCVI